MKKKLAFISLALACLTAAPLALAGTWKFAIASNSPSIPSEARAWEYVYNINSNFCNQGIYAGKYSPKFETSNCAAAPRKVGNDWVFTYYNWYVEGIVGVRNWY